MTSECHDGERPTIFSSSTPLLDVLLLELVATFRSRLVEDPDGPSDAVAAIRTLLDLIKNSKGEQQHY